MEILHTILTIAIMIIMIAIGVPFIAYIIGKPIWWIFEKLCGPFV